MQNFPSLSRKPALKTRGATVDPTLRDSFDNGMESTRARYTRRRRQWDISIDLLTPEDVTTLESFVENVAVYGANYFGFPDDRDPTNPQVYRVRFATIPSYNDAGNVADEFRQNTSFTIREV